MSESDNMARIYAGAGTQTIVGYATGSDGEPIRPTSASARIVDLHRHEDDNDREVVASTAATIDSVSTTTTAKAGPRAAHPRQLEVDSTTGFVVGRKYLVTDGPRRQAFTVDAVDEGDDIVQATEALRFEFGTGATVVGLGLLIDFPADVANDEDEIDDRRLFGIDWTAADGRPSRWRTFARIFRQGRQALASVADVLQIDQQLGPLTAQRSSLETHLRQAGVEFDALLRERSIDPERFEAGEAGKLAVAYMAVELAYQCIGGNEHRARAEWAGKKATRWLAMLRLGAPPIDTFEITRGGDRAVKPSSRNPFGRA